MGGNKAKFLKNPQFYSQKWPTKTATKSWRFLLYFQFLLSQFICLFPLVSPCFVVFHDIQNCPPNEVTGFLYFAFFPRKIWEKSGPVDALNRCHLSNWRFHSETVHFLSSKRPFLPTMFVSKCYKTKHFGQDSLFHKRPKLRRRNHYFYSVKMGERAKSL